MRKLNARIKTDTLVRFWDGENGLYQVKEITNDRKHFTVWGLVGSFQAAHIQKYTNNNRTI